MAGSLDYFNKVKLTRTIQPEGLHKQYQQATQGLDQAVAFEALEGGRFFGESDRKRYDELMAKRGQAKETAQTYKNNTNHNQFLHHNQIQIHNKQQVALILILLKHKVLIGSSVIIKTLLEMIISSMVMSTKAIKTLV